ncbi:uncharacterized protein PRCAT00004095001 [Priceomyces carsonii]|uniref:uncharacterized protein n=1 Tax=Priceomyces carsonii TaxID=28549 RepID=UPI002EDB6E5A|nr:unnamed protein product [Priceomyces carsonii]
MNRHSAREYSIWNMLHYGKGRLPDDDSEDEESEVGVYDEKMATEEPVTVEVDHDKKKWLRKLTLALTILIGIFYLVLSSKGGVLDNHLTHIHDMALVEEHAGARPCHAADLFNDAHENKASLKTSSSPNTDSGHSSGHGFKEHEKDKFDHKEAAPHHRPESSDEMVHESKNKEDGSHDESGWKEHHKFDHKGRPHHKPEDSDELAHEFKHKEHGSHESDHVTSHKPSFWEKFVDLMPGCKTKEEHKEKLMHHFKNKVAHKSGHGSSRHSYDRHRSKHSLFNSLRLLPAQIQSSNSPREVIEVSYPFDPELKYGKVVYSSVLVNHSFGNSYGHPFQGKFSPPKDIAFNRAAITLNTTVSGVQYDRLANLFVNGVEVWRTSTIEPGRDTAFSSFKKDITSYVNLFKDDADILFELNNLLNHKLTGSFDILMTIDFYFDPSGELFKPEADAEDLGEKYELFSVRRPADKVLPITVKDEYKNAHSHYLPNDKVSIQLPSLSANTTRLLLSVVASGNADEEFWYTNVIDRLKHAFHKRDVPLLGHGPMRYVNVYLNGKKVSVQVPEPVIFTGGISPAFWSATVSTDTFDVPSYTFDLSGLLPLLWESNYDPSEVNLSIEITNGLTELGKQEGPMVGHNWITTAHLLTYENDQVLKSTGEVINIDDTKKSNVVAIHPPSTGTLQQVVDGKFGAEISSNLVFTLRDGSVLNTTFSFVTNASTSNVQSYSGYGVRQNIVHSSTSKLLLSIIDNNSKKPVLIFRNRLNYPLVLSLTEENRSTPDELRLHYDFSLVHSKDERMLINDKTIVAIDRPQNGTSEFLLAPSGNHGLGKIDTKYKLKVSSPDNSKHYLRAVKAVNGTVTNDDTSDWTDSLPGKFTMKLTDETNHYDILQQAFTTFGYNFDYENGHGTPALNDEAVELKADEWSKKAPHSRERKFKKLIKPRRH